MSTTVQILLPAILAALASYLLTPLSARLAVRVGAVDRPGPRKVHTAPMPRLGGLAVIGAAAAGLAVFRLAGNFSPPDRSDLWQAMALSVLPVLAISIWDDISPLKAGPKFLAEALGAAIAVSLGITLGPEIHILGMAVRIGWLAAPVSWLWLVGIANAFNIVDGLDGLSAGLALIAAASLAAVFLMAHRLDMAVASLVLAGALVGFLPYNLYPASTFLGDSGSNAIGFCLACFALRGGTTLSAGLATLMPVLMLGLPVAETAVSIIRRAVARVFHRRPVSIFQPDRKHFHHRLLDLGLGHRNAVLILYSTALALAGAGLISAFVTTRQAGFLLLGLFMAGLVGVSKLRYQEFDVLRSGLVLKLYDTPVLKRSFFVVFADLVMVAAASFAAIALKYDGWQAIRAHVDLAVGMTVVLAPLSVIWFRTCGLYRGSWRLAGIDDGMRACRAVLGAAFSGYLVAGLAVSHPVPLSLFATYALLELMLAVGARLSYRALLWTRWTASHDGTPALIYGAGLAGVSALRELISNQEVGLRPVGFIDDDPGKVGTTVNGTLVLATLQGLAQAAFQTGAGAVVVSSGKIDAVRVRAAATLCRELGLRFVRMEIRFDESAPLASEELAGAGLLPVGARRL